MPNPYEQLPEAAFWRSAVARRHPLDIGELWTAKFGISQQDGILTAGSCFAQHIGRELAANDYTWIDSEPAPAKLSSADQRRFGYGRLSFRVGNIYTVAALRQWLEWASGQREPSREAWTSGDRVYDPFRPAVEPDGFASFEEMAATRRVTLEAIRRALLRSDLLILTLGLTEAWIDRDSGSIYPVCPGTLAGAYDARRHQFHNYSYAEVIDDLTASFALIQSLNPDMRFVLTVSPVPLTATAASQHVLVATTHAKSVLRAAAGHLASVRPDVDYFPAYEIISGFPFRGMFYEADMRNVSRHGVAFVMQAFFAGLRGGGEPARAPQPRAEVAPNQAVVAASVDDVACEEMLLAAFQRDDA